MKRVTAKGVAIIVLGGYLIGETLLIMFPPPHVEDWWFGQSLWTLLGQLVQMPI